MTGNEGAYAAATWRRGAAPKYPTMMQTDHSRAPGSGRRCNRHTDYFHDWDML
jgi:hypothetical protein